MIRGAMTFCKKKEKNGSRSKKRIRRDLSSYRLAKWTNPND